MRAVLVGFRLLHRGRRFSLADDLHRGFIFIRLIPVFLNAGCRGEDAVKAPGIVL